MQQQWVIQNSTDEGKVTALSKAININETLASILVNRGIDTFEKAKDFFRPSLEHLHDPFLMKDMDKAVRRLDDALNAGEKVLIYGDYDVDGTTSVSVFFGFLAQGYDTLDFYIPDRYSEGYGVSKAGIDYAIENNFSLIITLDCGIKAVNMVGYAKENGIDVIVCDHHLPGEVLPPAKAILDPKQKGCGYPYKELSGCGVGFKLLQGFCIVNEIPMEELIEYIDLVAVSIASDIVPITGENRVLAYYGLKKLNENPGVGLKALIEISGFKNPQINITNVVFGLGPRINAAGRIKHAKDAVFLLLSQDEELAHTYAEVINDKNITRKEFDKSITQEALEMIETDPFLQKAKSTVLYKEGWHKGVIGIVASRCIESFYRPTIVLTKSNGVATGSARSVHDFDVYEAIDACSDLLEQYGGHTHAAGVTLKVENIDAFRQKFEEVVSNRIQPDQLKPKIDVDAEIDLSQVSEKFYKIVTQMEPFGPGNMQPVFVARGVTGSGRIVGEDHLKIAVNQNGASLEGIGFGMKSFLPIVESGEPFDICFQLFENEFNGNRKIELYLKDIKPVK